MFKLAVPKISIEWDLHAATENSILNVMELALKDDKNNPGIELLGAVAHLGWMVDMLKHYGETASSPTMLDLMGGVITAKDIAGL